MKILVFVEQRDGQIKTASLEALAKACSLAGDDSSNVSAVLLGHEVASLSETLKEQGADTIYFCESGSLKDYQVLHYTDALESAVKTQNPDVILAAATPMGRDLTARLAARLQTGLITDATEIIVEGGAVSGAKKPVYAGKAIAKITFQANCGPRILSLRPNVFAADAKKGSGQAVACEAPGNSHEQLKSLGVKKGTSETADLTEASTIISGGRALGSEENFKVLTDCAEVVQATVGASRAAVDSGYASHDMQVGQTGKTVNPNLYVACGISGSIQHMAGMRTSKVIVAINTDEDAPIFSVADYGIVADLFEVVPALQKKLQALV